MTRMSALETASLTLFKNSDGGKTDEEFLLSNSGGKIFPLIKGKSAPVDSTQINTNTENENSKSETAEDLTNSKNDTSKSVINQKNLSKNQERSESKA